jgi:pilus assembly protein TadC
MKRSYLLFIVALLVVFSTGVWLFSTSPSFDLAEILQFGVIGLLVIFALLIGYSRFKSERRGEPSEDELSKTIMMKASSLSYFISIYLWLVLMYINDKGRYESDLIFGSGILGMGLIFAVSYLVIRWRGIRNG